LEFFYPVHYQVGKALEDVLRSGLLTRKQVAMLWLIRSEGEQRNRIRRKEMQRLIATWFEISGPSITRALRAMARPPLALVRLAEDPSSGREKMVLLTAKGERFLEEMVKQGQQFLRPLLSELSTEDIGHGLQFFRCSLGVIRDAHIGSLATAAPADTTTKKTRATSRSLKRHAVR
jgi:DNA-binding MarR family transcriptional regulator